MITRNEETFGLNSIPNKCLAISLNIFPQKKTHTHSNLINRFNENLSMYHYHLHQLYLKIEIKTPFGSRGSRRDGIPVCIRNEEMKMYLRLLTNWLEL